jgi:hypothetical protein
MIERYSGSSGSGVGVGSGVDVDVAVGGGTVAVGAGVSVVQEANNKPRIEINHNKRRSISHLLQMNTVLRITCCVMVNYTL